MQAMCYMINCCGTNGNIIEMPKAIHFIVQLQLSNDCRFKQLNDLYKGCKMENRTKILVIGRKK